MNTEAAIKEFLDALADPDGIVQYNARKSFRRGQEVEELLRNSIAAKHGVDPRVLVDAELKQRIEILTRPSKWRAAVGM